MDAINEEVAYRRANGQEHVSMATFIERYAQLGYRFDRRDACRSTARHMTGKRAGLSYPCVSLYPVQADNGVSAWNVDARRDGNFQAMQQLRHAIFVVCRGYIVEV